MEGNIKLSAIWSEGDPAHSDQDVLFYHHNTGNLCQGDGPANW